MNVLKIARGGIIEKLKEQAAGRGKTALLIVSGAIALSAMPFAAHAAESASATAELAISVNTCDGEMRAVSPKDVEYSPSWCGEGEQGSYVVIEKVVHAGMFNAATSTVTTCAADAEGAFSYSTGGGEPCVRFIHRVYSGEGQEIGTPLVRDVSFGVSSSPGAAVFADCRTNSLQEAVSARGAVNLAYSTDWATNAASVKISAVRLSAEGGDDVSTNTFFSAAASAEGVTAMQGVSAVGWWRLLLEVVGSDGSAKVNYASQEFKLKGGAMLIVF